MQDKKVLELLYNNVHKVSNSMLLLLLLLSRSVISDSVAQHAPLSMGFPRQEYWSRWPLPLPGDLPDSGIEPGVLV